MSIVNVLVGMFFVFLVISTWLLATKEGQVRLQKMRKQAKIVVFGGTAITLILAFLLSTFFEITANPDLVGRQRSTPANIGQVVAIEGYEIQLINASFARDTHYGQQNKNQLYSHVSVNISIVCTTESICPKGKFTLTVPGTDSDWTYVSGLSERDQRTITLEEFPMSGVDVSSSYLDFTIETPNRRYEAFFDLELDN